MPVFAMLALGLFLGSTGKITRTEAVGVNKIAFLVLQPALIFQLVQGLQWSEFRVGAIALYAACQVFTFTLTYLIAHRLLNREPIEAWLLAMATILVNTLLYVWPISLLIYGEAASLPVSAIVAWDTAIVFSLLIVITDLMANKKALPVQAIRRLCTNPVLIAITLGMLSNALEIPMPEPVLTATQFAGAAAAPLILFALGVILSGHVLIPSSTIIFVSAIKLAVFPTIIWAALQFGQRPSAWNSQLVLTAAGPSGAMAFSLAVLHGVRTDQIAPVIVWTSVLSLLSLAWLA